MDKREWGAMDERDFETLLQSSLSELPPDDVVAGVTPWKKAMDRVLIGMALRTVTLNFWCLDYLLPTVGTLLSLLGYRSLRRENKWFRACFILSAARVIFLFPLLIVNTTILRSQLLTSASSALTITNLLLTLLEFFCLWRGLRAVQEKVQLPPQAGGAVALILWYVFMGVLAAVQYSGLILAGAMLIGYFFILRSIYKLSNELDEAGYSVQTAFVRITDRWLALALVLVLVVGCTLGYLFGGSYPMAWAAVDPSEQAEVEDIKEQLMELGFPAYVLSDLTPEDIAACEGALRVVVDVVDEPVNNGRPVSTEYMENGVRQVHMKTVYDVKELRLTSVGVQIPGEHETWILFHHFLWTTDPGFYGTESIQLWPVYRHISEAWAPAGEATGRVLYDQDGTTLSAPYYFLGRQTYTSNSPFWGSQMNTDIFAAFSMPAKGGHYRGYVAYPVEELRDGYIISSWINYTHQKSWLQYPAVTAMEMRMTNSWNDAGAFRTIQDALQFYPTDDGIELIR